MPNINYSIKLTICGMYRAKLYVNNKLQERNCYLEPYRGNTDGPMTNGKNRKANKLGSR